MKVSGLDLAFVQLYQAFFSELFEYSIPSCLTQACPFARVVDGVIWVFECREIQIDLVVCEPKLLEVVSKCCESRQTKVLRY